MKRGPKTSGADIRYDSKRGWQHRHANYNQIRAFRGNWHNIRQKHNADVDHKVWVIMYKRYLEGDKPINAKERRYFKAIKARVGNRNTADVEAIRFWLTWEGFCPCKWSPGIVPPDYLAGATVQLTDKILSETEEAMRWLAGMGLNGQPAEENVEATSLDSEETQDGTPAMAPDKQQVQTVEKDDSEATEGLTFQVSAEEISVLNDMVSVGHFKTTSEALRWIMDQGFNAIQERIAEVRERKQKIEDLQRQIESLRMASSEYERYVSEVS